MTDYFGGSRARLIKRSVFELIDNGIRDLGWYDSGRNHLSVRFSPKPVDSLETKLSQDLKPNLITLTDEDDNEEELEMGSLSMTTSWNFYVDIYAEDSSVGIDLSRDIRDILQGRHDPNRVSEQGPRLQVYDYDLATPVPIFYCDIENVDRGRVKTFVKPWQKFWYLVGFDIVDSY